MLNTTIIEVQPQLYKKVTTFTSPELNGTKAVRAETVFTATVTVNGLVFDADEDSMNRISRHIQLANYKFNKLTSENDATAYQTAYVDTTVDWKLADNTIETVTIETLCEVMRLSVAQLTEAWL